jgi:hypothetical protein
MTTLALRQMVQYVQCYNPVICHAVSSTHQKSSFIQFVFCPKEPSGTFWSRGHAAGPDLASLCHDTRLAIPHVWGRVALSSATNFFEAVFIPLKTHNLLQSDIGTTHNITRWTSSYCVATYYFFVLKLHTSTINQCTWNLYCSVFMIVV